MTDSDKEIIIALEKKTFSLGEPMGLAVVYRNISEAPLSFPDPARTWSVGLQVTAPDGTVQHIRFGKKMRHRTANGAEVTTLEQVDTIALEPGTEHRFLFSLSDRCPDVLPPGTHTLAVVDSTDDKGDVSSNRLTITIQFTEASVPLLLDVLATSTNSLFRREWAALWLKELNPDVASQIAWDTDSDTLQEEDEHVIRNEVDQYRMWWLGFKDSDALRPALDRVNAAHVEL